MKRNISCNLLYGLSGVVLIAFAVVLQIKANFGLDSLNALYGNLSLITGFSFGFFSICLGFFFVMIHAWIAKKTINWGALVIAFLIGSSVDFFIRFLFPYLSADTLQMRLLLFVVGIVLYGIGIALLIFSKMPSPLEEWQFAIQALTGQSVANSKFLADLSLFALALCAGLVSHIGWGQIQIGTLLITLSIGKIISHTLKFLET